MRPRPQEPLLLRQPGSAGWRPCTGARLEDGTWYRDTCQVIGDNPFLGHFLPQTHLQVEPIEFAGYLLPIVAGWCGERLWKKD
jgi:hypothetical protein